MHGLLLVGDEVQEDPVDASNDPKWKGIDASSSSTSGAKPARLNDLYLYSAASDDDDNSNNNDDSHSSERDCDEFEFNSPSIKSPHR